MSDRRHPFVLLLIFAGLSTSFVVAGDWFDYHSVRGRKPKAQIDGVFEGEAMLMPETARAQKMTDYQGEWSGDAHFLWYGKPGESAETGFRIDEGGRYRIEMQLTQAQDYGVVSITFNGKELAGDFDLYAPKVQLANLLELGEVQLEAGTQNIELKITGSNEHAKEFGDGNYLLGLDFVKLERIDPPNGKISEETPQSPASDDALATVTSDQVQPVLKEYCIKCHGEEKMKGKVNLELLTTKEAFVKDIELTRKIVDAVVFREMPPEDEKQPAAEARALLSRYFLGIIDEHLAASAKLAPVVMRRMNRYEYNNSVRDLLQLKGDIYPLPEKPIRAAAPYFDPASGRFPDSVRISNRALGKNQIEQHILTGVVPFAIDLQSEHGFNNRGDELSFSPILLESFLKIGHSIVTSPEFDGYTALTPTLFAAPAQTGNERSIAQERLTPLLERACRRPPEATTTQRYVDYFEGELARTKSFSQSMKSVVAAILASPRFLYLVERSASADEGGKSAVRLDAYELATRLSFFLWSTIPDAPLMEAARSGELHDSSEFSTQITRMLEHPKSQSLSQNFARQWLRLDQLITAVPDFDRFEFYYSRIGCEQWKFGLQTMAEPLLLFENIMVEDRSIMLLIDSNFAYRSDEMESWYRDEVPFEGKKNRDRFNTNVQTYKRRSLRSRREGGVITSAAPLTMTSSPLRTSPITRGSWIASVIFNKPPPPPPDIVPEIEADDADIEAKGLTLRQRLEQHQVNQSCVSCHQKIDPMGFALENFDAVGRWRDTYRSGLEIDASGVLFGEAEFRDIVGLKDALLKKPEWFMRAFTEHLLSYALGRGLNVSDNPAIDKIVRRVRKDDGRFSTVVREIAKSYPFLNKTTQPEASR